MVSIAVDAITIRGDLNHIFNALHYILWLNFHKFKSIVQSEPTLHTLNFEQTTAIGLVIAIVSLPFSIDRRILKRIVLGSRRSRKATERF